MAPRTARKPPSRHELVTHEQRSVTLSFDSFAEQVRMSLETGASSMRTNLAVSEEQIRVRDARIDALYEEIRRLHDELRKKGEEYGALSQKLVDLEKMRHERELAEKRLHLQAERDRELFKSLKTPIDAATDRFVRGGAQTGGPAAPRGALKKLFELPEELRTALVAHLGRDDYAALVDWAVQAAG